MYQLNYGIGSTEPATNNGGKDDVKTAAEITSAQSMVDDDVKVSKI